MERIDKFKSVNEWPFNFIYLLHDHNPMVPGADDIWPEDFIATLEYLLMTKVKAEHRIELILYYRDGKSLAEIGREREYSSQGLDSAVAFTSRISSAIGLFHLLGIIPSKTES